MKVLSAIGSGLAGACALTILHEVIRKIDPNAPRMDLLGMNALSKILKKAGQKVPKKDALFGWTMAGDVLSNSIYYSLVGFGGKKHSWQKGAALGLAAGLGAVLLPKALGLNEAPSNRTTETKVMTVAWYLIGGLVTSAVASLFDKESK